MKKLYKYIPYNQYLFNMLINNEFWMSPPDKLNDPFEGDFRIKDIEKYQNESTIKRMLEFNRRNIIDDLVFDDILKTALNDTNVLSNILYECINKQIRSRFGITCFSRTPSSVRMWSHYADSHKGVCLIFDEDKLFKYSQKKQDSITIKDVCYSESLPIIDIDNHESDEDSFEYTGISSDISFLFNKLKSWNYEKEVRLIYDQNFDEFPERKIKFNIEALVGVVFGSRMQTDNKSALLSLLKGDTFSDKIIIHSAVKGQEKPFIKIVKIIKNTCA